MATFRFRAEAALDLRRRQEQAAAGDFARAQAAFREAGVQRAHIVAEREAALAAGAARQRAGTDAAALEWHWNWINRLAAAIEELDREIEARRRRMADAEAAWQHARRRRRALEKMRERALCRFQAAEARLERKTVDELARVRFVAPEAGVRREEP